MNRRIIGACILLATGLTPVLTAQSYVPNRVFDTRRGAFTDFETMAADLAKADVVFIGEQHDDPNTHRLELAVLEALARRGRSVVVSMEMFERDVQEPLDHFLMGHMTDDEFMKATRPWPRYVTDYKPLVDFADLKEWPIVAANVPRAIASEVAKGGLEVLKAKNEADRKLFAAELKCPLDDAYFTRFVEAMGGHPAAGGAGADEQARRTNERYYFSQCVKDETMAESIAQGYAVVRTANKAATIVHFNGAFHSDYREGTAARTVRRVPNARIVVVSIQPVPDLDNVVLTERDRALGEYVLFTIRKP